MPGKGMDSRWVLHYQAAQGAAKPQENRNSTNITALKKFIALEFRFCPDHYPCTTLSSCQRECPRVPWINFHPAHSIHSSPIFKWIQMEMDGDGPSSFLKPEEKSFSPISHTISRLNLNVDPSFWSSFLMQGALRWTDLPFCACSYLLSAPLFFLPQVKHAQHPTKCIALCSSSFMGFLALKKAEENENAAEGGKRQPSLLPCHVQKKFNFFT